MSVITVLTVDGWVIAWRLACKRLPLHYLKD